MFPKINLAEYSYNLPNEKIAFFPLENRDECKLLCVNKIENSIKTEIFKDLDKLIPKNTSLFINSSKVIFARIFTNKVNGGKAEIFLTSPISPSKEYITALDQKCKVIWNCIIGGKNIKTGDKLFYNYNSQIIEFTVSQKNGNEAIVEFDPSKINLSVREFLNQFGNVPLPPYIRRDNIIEDKMNYQTIYANLEGSVAAPTAGLHFTDLLMQKLNNKGFGIFELTLHVGLGTFKPINTDNLEEFDMHSERIIIKKSDILNLKNAIESKNNILAVGTTSTRILESIFWIGYKLIESPSLVLNYDTDIFDQFYPYKSTEKVSSINSINAILKYLDDNKINEITVRTKLLIVPGYDFKIVDMMITNFHQPKSTLILLVAAFIGKELWEKSYHFALENNYRFLSYGDANLLIKNKI